MGKILGLVRDDNGNEMEVTYEAGIDGRFNRYRAEFVGKGPEGIFEFDLPLDMPIGTYLYELAKKQGYRHTD